jgi:hypothetical protein
MDIEFDEAIFHLRHLSRFRNSWRGKTERICEIPLFELMNKILNILLHRSVLPSPGVSYRWQLTKRILFRQILFMGGFHWTSITWIRVWVDSSSIYWGICQCFSYTWRLKRNVYVKFHCLNSQTISILNKLEVSLEFHDKFNILFHLRFLLASNLVIF